MKPTYEDIVKYHSQKTKLLVKIDCYALPMEIEITAVLNEGEIFQYGNSMMWSGGQWVMTRDVEVLHIFPPMELVRRIQEINNPPLKDVKKVDETNDSIEAMLVKYYEDVKSFKQGKK